MKNAKLQSFTITGYYGKPSAHGTIQFDGGSMSLVFDDVEIADISALIFQVIQRKKGEIVEQVRNLETPMLLTSDAPTIEGASLQPPDDIPF